MIRIILFLVTNIAVMLLFSIVMFFMNVRFLNLINLLIISGIVGFSGSIISLCMSKYIALFAVRGKILKQDMADEKEMWLLRIVCAQSKKLGIVIPQVVVYESLAMNAFATGPRRNSALVAVSTGLLKNMHNNEIESVVAHEMTHIYNGDMVTLTLLQGVMNTFVVFVSRVLAQCIAYCMSLGDGASEDNNDEENLFQENSSIYLFISIILESVFGILASIVTLWFSRHREFYADAGAAKLVGTYNMIAALKRLKLSYEPKESNIVMSLCIHGKKNRNMFSELFMSHPSIDARIEALRDEVYFNKERLFF
ncbi:protease HtpX [Blochmannia endosymbiont of Polyrhachis (Hedomyrma) turneri]|uniref:protease HtpX n=1 Tax=Blochmannia endosymbiont of Polyrhachis (Hedomyrma) turneri TaxID=1505596 RepID=UPI00061A5F31|nr:protease HtpX [Blochmannia endosymbiont of Polyrhachis (Hedomyrma) turneri]AKC60013.1 protease HtpX [Blochmannia endosymbiont of Polyrhachis (Hedomyrma) turneri]